MMMMMMMMMMMRLFCFSFISIVQTVLATKLRYE